MKNIFKIIATAAVGLAVLSSCSKEQKGGVYTPGEGDGLYTFYRASESDIVFSPENPELTIQVVRATASGEATLNLITAQYAGETPCDVIDVPATVTFKDGEYNAYFTVGYKNSIEMNVNYDVVISIADEDCTPGGISSTSFGASRAFDWKSIGKGQFYDENAYLDAEWDANTGALLKVNDYNVQEVEIMQAYNANTNEDYQRWRVVNPFGNREEMVWPAANLADSYSQVWEFFVVNEETGAINYSVINPGINHSAYGPMSYGMPGNFSSAGFTNENLKIQNNLANLSPMVYVSAGYFGVYPTYVSLPGGPDLEQDILPLEYGM